MNNFINCSKSLHQISLFNEVKQPHFDALVSVSELKSIKKNKYAYKPGETASRVYFLQKGRIKICSYNKLSKEVIKNIHYPGEMFGEDSLLERDTYEDYAQAMDRDVEVLSINASWLKKFICSNPALSIRLSTKIGSKLKAAQKRIENFVFKNARSRIVELIKELAQKQGQNIGYEVLIKNFLTHNEISSIIGTSRQTVTIVLNELKKSDQIHIDRRNVLVRNIESLS